MDRVFRYDLLLGDIVMASGEIAALDLETAEQELETSIMPGVYHDRYFIGEVVEHEG